MKRRLKLNLAIVAFLLFAVFAAAFILKNDRGNTYNIERESAPSQPTPGTSQTQPKDDTKNGESAQPTSEPEKEANLSPLIEKYKGKEIVKVNTTQKVVALTFDAGANADGVDRILPILKENNIKGTFFLTGKFIEKYPDKVRKIVASGGDIGNHTYDHPYLTHLSPEGMKTEIKGAEDAFAKVDGKFDPFLRAPYGDRNQSVLDTVSGSGYINIRWTVDSLGWKGTSGGQTKTSVEQKVLKNTSPGAIIMMHLGSNPDDKTHLDSEALPAIIEKLRSDGYEFKTLSELLESGQ